MDGETNMAESLPTEARFNVRILKKREKRRTTYATIVDKPVKDVMNKVKEVLEREDFLDGLIEIEKVQ